MKPYASMHMNAMFSFEAEKGIGYLDNYDMEVS